MKKFILISVLSILSLSALAAPKFPASVFERPFTMPQNSFETALRFTNSNIAELDVDYGITDNFQLGLGWGGMSVGNEPTQEVSLNLVHFLFSTRYVSSMATLTVPFNFNAQVLQKMTFGMPTYVPVIRGHVNLVFLENLATVNWAENAFADFAFGARLSWQATHSLCLNLITSSGTLSTSGNHTHIIEETPLKLKALFAITPMVDLVGSVGFDNIQHVGKPSAGFSAMLGFALRGGDIEG